MAFEMPSFIFGAGTKARTPKEAEQLRAMSQALALRGGTPKSLGEGLSAIGDAFVARKYMDDASSAEEAGRQQALELFTGLTADGTTPDRKAILDALSNPWLDENQQSIVGTMAANEFKTKAPRTDVVGGKLVNLDTGAVIGDYSTPPEKMRPLTADEKSSYGIPATDARPYQINDQTGEIKLVGGAGSTTNVTVGGGSKGDEELDKGEGQQWAGFLEAGTVSAGTAQDFDVLNELISGGAPQDPLGGRLVQMFPGLDSRGAAFQSVVSRIAPTLRAPGSGATSDIEYQGFLNALPSLTNKPEANALIAEVMQSKARINIARAEAVTEYANSDRTREDKIALRTKLKELNSAKLITPEMQQKLAAVGVQVTPAQVTPETGTNAAVSGTGKPFKIVSVD